MKKEITVNCICPGEGVPAWGESFALYLLRTLAERATPVVQ